MPSLITTKKSSNFTTRDICLTAVMTALVFVATFVPKIPIPLGYAHLGDAVIFLLVLFLPQRNALLAACLGSALADLLGGFPLWILPTIIIKFLMAQTALLISGAPLSQASNIKLLSAFIAGSIVMAIGYTVFGAILFNSLSAGLASTPGLLAEGLLNSLIAIILVPFVAKKF